MSKPQYAASAQLFVTTQGNDSVGDLNQGNAFAQGRVSSYVSLATSNRVLGDVGEQLDLTVDQLRGSVTAENPVNTVLINVRATSGNAQSAARIANAAADHLVELVNSVENSGADDGAVAPVTLTKVQDAGVPTYPFAPSTTRNLLLGVVLSLIAGVSAALLIERFDTRLRGRAAIEEVSDASILGTFAPETGTGSELLLRDLETYSGRAEAYRQLRTHLQFVGVDGGVRSVLMTSSVPGEGKSTTAANLAIVLAENGVRVLLVDADLRRPRIDSLLGLERSVGLTTVLTGRIALEDAIQEVSFGQPLSVLTAGALPPNPSEMLASARMEQLVADMTDQFDVVIIDSPPLVGVSDPSSLATMVSGVLLVASADGRLHRDQFTQALENLKFVHARLFGLVLNRVDLGKRKGYYGYESRSEPEAPPTARRAPRSARKASAAAIEPEPGPRRGRRAAESNGTNAPSTLADDSGSAYGSGMRA